MTAWTTSPHASSSTIGCPLRSSEIHSLNICSSDASRGSPAEPDGELSATRDAVGKGIIALVTVEETVLMAGNTAVMLEAALVRVATDLAATKSVADVAASGGEAAEHEVEGLGVIAS